MKTRKLTLLLSLGISVTLCAAGCSDPAPAGSSETPPASSSTPIPENFGTLPPTWGSGPQAPEDPNAPKPSPVTWTAESKQAATDVAVKFMGAYAKPQAPQPGWAESLVPFASVELMNDFRAVNTAYVTTRNPGKSGKLSATDFDPYNATVVVTASEGPWTLGVHRQPDGSWRVSSLQPPMKKGH